MKTLKILVMVTIVSTSSFLSGCEDPMSSMMKSTMQAGVDHAKIESQIEMKEMEIALEREKLHTARDIAQSERNHELTLAQLRAQEKQGNGLRLTKRGQRLRSNFSKNRAAEKTNATAAGDEDGAKS